MTEIYLIRHAQAEGNLYRLMQGHWDGALTALGREQILALRERFRGEKVDVLYSSDLYRTVQTAMAISESCGLEVHTDPRLREINIGPWEAKFFNNLRYDYPVETEQFLIDPESWQLDGAETYEQVRHRAYEALCEIAQANEGKRVAIVSHGVTIRCLLSKIMNVRITGMSEVPICGNTSICTINYDNGKFSIVGINDSKHLEHLAMRPWHSALQLRCEPFDMQRDGEYYKACYTEAWQNAHGNLQGFRAETYFKNAVEHSKYDAGAVLHIYEGEKSAGIVDMDTRRGEHANYGWVSFLYLEPEFRGKGGGIQLLGRAIEHYKELGRTALRLHVAESNTEALKFYKRWGFETIGEEYAPSGRMFLMEKKIGRHTDV